MNYGLYLSASGALLNMHRFNVLANNLANINTVGFKPDSVDLRQRLPERLEASHPGVEPNWLLERLGGGAFAEPTRVSLKQGELVDTGSDFDVAIEGPGFFVLAGPPDAPGEQRLTRDGRFVLNGDGELVTAAEGRRVLDETSQSIQLDASTPVKIGRDGTITQDGDVVGRLRVVAAPEARGLEKAGGNMLRLKDGNAAALPPFAGRLHQGYTEGSAVNAIMTMNSLMSAAKAAQGNLKMMQYHDQILGSNFNTFGRVA